MKLMSVRMFLLFPAITLVLSLTACGQRGLPVKDDELRIAFEFVGKAGDTSKFAITAKDLPSPMPIGYKIAKIYLVKTDAILYGESILTAKVESNSESQFNQTRFLKLQATELNPSGWEWNDCTISSEESIRASDPYIVEERFVRIKKYLPDLREKRVSCLNDDLKAENYFALVFQTQPPPAAKFSEIEFSVDSVASQPQESGIPYRLLFRNAGNKTIRELNFVSHFQVDTALSSFKTDNGKCQRSKSGTNFGSVVCYLKDLAPGATAVVELTAVPSDMRSQEDAGPYNRGWLVMGVIKEQADSPLWPRNMFMFSPLKKE